MSDFVVWTLRVTAGAWLVNAALDEADCSLGTITMRRNTAVTVPLTIPWKRPELAALVVEDAGAGASPRWRARGDVQLELYGNGELWTHLRPAGVQLVAVNSSDPNGIEVTLADTRFEQQCRFVGRWGFRPSVAGVFPTDWDEHFIDSVVVGPETTQTDPYGNLNATRLEAAGAGPNYHAKNFEVTALGVDRKIGLAGMEWLPGASWDPNEEEDDFGSVLATMTIIDAVTADVIERGYSQVVASKLLPQNTWIPFATPALTIPAGADVVVSVVHLLQNGLTLAFDVRAELEEALVFEDTDIAAIIRALVDHLNDSINWGHSDTGVRASTSTIPDVGKTISRTWKSDLSTRGLQAIGELCDMGGLYQRLIAQSDGTDDLYADLGGTTCPISADTTNARLEGGGIQQTADNVGDTVAITAPDTNDWLGNPLAVFIGPTGILPGHGVANDLGREFVVAGPYSQNYDPRVFGLAAPYLYRAHNDALTITFKLLPNSGAAAAILDRTLTNGAVMGVAFGEMPVGITGTIRVEDLEIDPAAQTVIVTANLEPV